jgi:hypothetical protein
LHKINTSKIRNSDVNKVSNNGNTEEEIMLDLSAEYNEKRHGLTQRQRKCPVTSSEDFVWN